MKYLVFDVKNMAISKSTGDKTNLISGAVGYFGLQFNFDEEFSDIPGAKAVEFIKKNNKERKDLVDGKCEIPNWILTDKDPFQMRVTCGNTIGTQWAQVGITEGGIIMPEEPEEEAPSGMEYVKTQSGDEAVPYLKATSNGLEFSQDGQEWQSGVSGVPEVLKTKKPIPHLRVYGDWIPADEYLAENGGETNAIDEIKVNDVALPITDKSVNIDLSEYAKSADIANTYATQATVNALQTMTGTAETVSELDYSTSDISTVVTAFNGLLTALKARGVIS